jgi:hypothetical protein
MKGSALFLGVVPRHINIHLIIVRTNGLRATNVYSINARSHNRDLAVESGARLSTTDFLLTTLGKMIRFYQGDAGRAADSGNNRGIVPRHQSS